MGTAITSTMWILAVAVLLYSPIVALSDDIFVSVPNTLKLGVPNNIVVYLNSGSSQKVVVEAYNNGARVAQANKTVDSGSPNTLSLVVDAKDIDGGPTGSPCNGSVTLLVTCPALSLRRQVEVALDCSGASVFIFTDKSVYTPGQTVSLRIACLDWRLTTYEEKLTIDIKNPQGIIVRRWTSMTPKLGLADESFTIDVEPQLGWWTVEVYPGPDSKAMPLGNSKFEVKEYVVPRFGVSIVSPDYIKNSTESFQVTVKATYTYGEAVRGFTSIEFGALFERNYRPVIRQGYPEWTKPLIGGEATFDIKVKTITDGLPYGFPLGGRLRVTARVTSDGVGLIEETSVEKTVFSVKSVILDISRSRGFFKPGLPFDLEVLARKPNGVPVAAVDITLQAFFKTEGQEEWSQIQFQRDVRSVRRTDLTGFADFVFDIPRKSTKLKLQLQADGDPWTETELFPEASSVNDRYLFLRGTRKAHNVCIDRTCGQEHFNVYSSDSDITVNLCHMLICRGVIEVSKCRSASSWPTQVSIELRPYTSPCCKLLVFYQVGSVFVADYVVVYSQLAFPNKIAIRTLDQGRQPFYQPKASVQLEISGLPGSMVYLSAVDEGVLLLGDNRLSAVEILNKLRGCKLGCDAIGGRDMDGIFKNAGLLYTSLTRKIDYSPICFPPPKLEPTLPNLEACCESGIKHCQECKVRRQLLVDEGIYTETCLDAFTKCCAEASLSFTCTLQSRARNQGGSSFLNGHDIGDLPTRYRSYFPESWLKRVEVISDRGVTRIGVNVPDTITTWQVNAIGTSRTGLYGMAAPIRLTVFSIIFLEVSLPYSVVRNEQFAVKATVFNYNKVSAFHNVKVELVSRSFNVCTTAGTGKLTEKQTLPILNKLSSHTFIFPVVPLSIGDVDIEVVLTTSFYKDNVKKTVKVKPEGVENEIAYSNAADPSSYRGMQKFSYDLSSPAEAVTGSTRSFLFATGNLLGPVVALEGFEDLLRQPYGCGEQNMVNFCPNVIVLLYLKRTSQLTDRLLMKGVSNIRHGYSRQLLFRRTQPPGSFSAFGDSDYHGSTWLTAFVLKCFCQVNNLGLSFEVVDKSVVNTGLEWLSTQQLLSGQFEERGRVLDFSLQGSVGTYECSMTSFVLIAYLECSAKSNNFSVNIAPAMSLGVNYVLNCVNLPDPCGHTFELAISGYALCLANRKREAAVTMGKLWNCANVNLRDRTADWVDTSSTKSTAVETAAYATLGFMCMKDVASASLVVNWLNTQRGLGGGFVSTQDTVVAIQALAAYAGQRQGKSSSLNVAVTSASKSSVESIAIGDSNANVRHSISVSPNSEINVRVTGSGTGLLQAGLKYNTLQKSSKCNFSINVETNYNEETNKMRIEINISYAGQRETGMAVVEVRLLSGFSADEQSLKAVITDTDAIQRYDNRGETVNFYFNQISSQTSTVFSFKAERKEEVGFLQSAPIRVYDYYNPDISCTVFYAPDGESPLLSLLCKGSTCQCGAGKCPYCHKLGSSRQRIDKDTSSCEKFPTKLAGTRKIKIEDLKTYTCQADFAYKFTVMNTRTSCNNGWTKVLGKLDAVFKPGFRDMVVGKKIRVWKRADCSCPSFHRRETYLYIGNDGPKFMVDYNSIVLKWDRRQFKPYITLLKDKALCE